MGSTPCGAIHRFFLLQESIKVITKSCFSIRDAPEKSGATSNYFQLFCALSFYKYKDMNEKSLESLEMSHSFIE